MTWEPVSVWKTEYTKEGKVINIKHPRLYEQKQKGLYSLYFHPIGGQVYVKELREKTFDVHQCMTVAEAVGVPYHQLDIFIGEKGCFSMMQMLQKRYILLKKALFYWHRQFVKLHT